MKYTLHGFSQKVALEFAISNDELAILRWFVDFKDSGAMKKEYDPIKNCMYYWVVYNKIIEDLPLIVLGSNSIESQKKKLQRLLNGNLSKVLNKKIKRDKDGTYLLLAINEENYIKLISDISTGQKCPTPTDKNVQPLRTKMSNPYGQKCPNKDSSINNTSINNIIKKNKKKTEFDELIENYTENIDLRKNIYEFIKMRKGIKAAITTLGLKKILNKLDTSTTNDNDKIAILDNSIMNSWKGIFPLNNQNKANKELKFNNFEAREYDYDNLEKKLLGWDNDN